MGSGQMARWVGGQKPFAVCHLNSELLFCDEQFKRPPSTAHLPICQPAHLAPWPSAHLPICLLLADPPPVTVFFFQLVRDAVH